MVSGRGRFLEDDGSVGGMEGFVVVLVCLFFAEEDFPFEKMWSISDMVAG